MKLVNSYNAVTIASTLTVDDVEALKKYNPSALTLVDDKKPIFTVDFNECGTGDIGKFGIVFNCADANKHLFITDNQCLCNLTADAKTTQLKDEYGVILAHLKTVEDQAAAALGAVTAILDSVTDAIVIQ